MMNVNIVSRWRNHKMKNRTLCEMFGMKENLEDLNKQRTKMEIYSRVVGYLRPVDQWNPGKQQEYRDRRVYKI